jgi:ParB/RepB/Spo0J family partition protein
MPDESGPRLVKLPIDDITEASVLRNSRLREDSHALDELAASISRHGILQPIIVRPRGPDDSPDSRPYIVIAGNRRLRASRRAGLLEIACLVHVTDADKGFVLNVVENLQRRELSGAERVRAITLLGSLADNHGRPLGVRAISRRTGLAPSTISRWLRIDRQPALKAALEQEQLDIGRAMLLVGVPNEHLDGLIDRAPRLLQPELAHEIEQIMGQFRSSMERQVAADRRRAAAAERALLLIGDAPDPIRAILERIRRRVEELLAPPPTAGLLTQDAHVDPSRRRGANPVPTPDEEAHREQLWEPVFMEEPVVAASPARARWKPPLPRPKDSTNAARVP